MLMLPEQHLTYCYAVYTVPIVGTVFVLEVQYDDSTIFPFQSQGYWIHTYPVPLRLKWNYRTSLQHGKYPGILRPWGAEYQNTVWRLRCTPHDQGSWRVHLASPHSILVLLPCGQTVLGYFPPKEGSTLSTTIWKI